MRFVLALIVLAGMALAQPVVTIQTTQTDPTGQACNSTSMRLKTPDGSLYSCQNGTYAKISGTGGGFTPQSCVVTGTVALTWPATASGNTCTQYVLTRTANISNGGSIPVQAAGSWISILDTQGGSGTFTMANPTNAPNYPVASLDATCTISTMEQSDGANWITAGTSLNVSCSSRVANLAAAPGTPQAGFIVPYSLIASPGLYTKTETGSISTTQILGAQATGRNQTGGVCNAGFAEVSLALDHTPDCATAGSGGAARFMFAVMCKAAAVADNFVFYGGAGAFQPVSAGCSGTAPSAPYMQVPANNNGLGANAYQISITIPSLPSTYVSGAAITLDWNIFASDTTHVTTVNIDAACASTTLGALTPFTLQDTIGSTAASPFHQQVIITPPACAAFQPLLINLKFDNSALVTGPSAFSFTSVVASM